MSNARAPSFDDTIAVRDACLCLHLQRAARAVSRHFDDAFRPLDLTNGQFSLLMSLNRPQPAAIGAVAGLLAMDRTTLTAALKPLQRRGLVEIRPDPRDGRGRLLHLTEIGRQLLAAALPVWRREHRSIEATLGDGEADRLRRDLRALTGRDVAQVRNSAK